jgi:GntR family transcriptional regulator
MLVETTMSKLLKAYDRSRVPLYIQVASVMRQRIEAKQWRPGQKISTLVELEQEFQVARVTVRQAIDILREEGLLHCQQGRGTFVAAKPLSRHWLKLATSWDVLVASIKDNVPKRIRVDNPPPLPSLREGEGERAAKYVFLRTVQYKDGEPYGIVNLHLASDIYERDPNAFLQRTALSVLAGWKDIEIRHAHQTVVIGSANPMTADFLRIALGTPTAECRCVAIDSKGIAIYVADITYRSEVIQLHIDLLANTRAPSRRVERSRLPAETARTPGRGAGRRASRLRLLSS